MLKKSPYRCATVDMKRSVFFHLDLAERSSETEGGCIFQLHFLVRDKVHNSCLHSDN